MTSTVVITSRLGKDAELRYVSDGKAVSNFTLPVESGFGENKEVQWVKCTLWGKQAESLQPYLKKGTMVAVTGELAGLEVYTRNDGTPGATQKIRVERVKLLGSGQPNGSNQTTNATEEEEDDVPF